MFKLMVVSGPHQGESYQLPDGHVSIGRQELNSIVINSTKVSKQHCILVVSDGQVVLQDQGSSNGTFINGVLSNDKKLKSGDKISVGDVVFELIKMKSRGNNIQSGVSINYNSEPNPFQMAGEYNDEQQENKNYAQAHAVVSSNSQGFRNMQGMGNVIPFPTNSLNNEAHSDTIFEAKDVAPQDLVGKIQYYFEKTFMASVYNFNSGSEWRSICVLILSAFIIINITLSVYPLMKSNKELIIKEVQRRAKFVARDIVDRNTLAMATKTESKAEIGFIDKEPGIRFAVLADLNSRIIAPSLKAGQYLTNGFEAIVAVRARNEFQKGGEKGIVAADEDQTVVAVEPVKVFNPQKAMNEVVAMAIVSIDATNSVRGSGEGNLIYSETTIIHFIVGLLCFYVLYRLTVKPFEVLNDDIDQVLKGNRPQVTNDYQHSEFDPLFVNINAALQRVSRLGGDSGGVGVQSLGPDEVVAPLRSICESGGLGLSVLDSNMRIVSVNGLFSEITGISESMGLGQELISAARDQGISTLFSEMLQKTAPSTDGVSEDSEFSGVAYRIRTIAFGQVGVKPGSYAVVIEKKAS